MTGSEGSAEGAILLDGDRLRAEIIAEIRAAIAADERLLEVVLATVLVGDDPSSRVYVDSKNAHATAAGISSRIVEVGESDQTGLERVVSDLASDRAVHGILVQLPLPDGMATGPVLDAIPTEKDVDGLNTRSLGLLMSGKAAFGPCSPLAVIRFIERYGIETTGRAAVVVGSTAAAALSPLALLADERWQVTATLVHAASPDLAAVCRQADILVSVANQPGLITGAHIKPGAAVFDLGINGTAGDIPGDVRFEEAREIAGWLTPMPGGIGAMTIACLLENTLAAARLQTAVSNDT